jgi:hypothetical protein
MKQSNCLIEKLLVFVLLWGACVRVAAAGLAPKDWTVMVFLNGKNNLEEFALKDLNEMETAGSSGRVNIVAQLGRAKGYYAGDGDWTGARRYLVQKDAGPGKISSPVLAELGQADMGDYRSVMEFVRWARAAYPAKRYMLVIWNHGSGWTKTGSGRARGISYDDESGNHVTIPQLGEILRQTGPVDVYASDACLMQMAEVAWELKDYASYIVGSEETEPADGYPYDQVLAALNADPDMPARDLAGVLVSAYGKYYAAQGTGATMSAIKTSALPLFRELADNFAAAAMAAGDRGVIKRGLYYAQHYAYDDNKDLDSFLAYVAAKSANARLRGAAAELSTFLRGELVTHKAASNYFQTPEGLEPVDYSLAGGLAVYLPGTKPPPAYAELAWAKDTSWDDFLLWLSGVPAAR